METFPPQWQKSSLNCARKAQKNKQKENRRLKGFSFLHRVGFLWKPLKSVWLTNETFIILFVFFLSPQNQGQNEIKEIHHELRHPIVGF